MKSRNCQSHADLGLNSDSTPYFVPQFPHLSRRSDGICLHDCGRDRRVMYVVGVVLAVIIRDGTRELSGLGR